MNPFVPRLEVHRVHRYPKLRFDLAEGMSFDEALRASPSRPSAAFNIERFLDNPNPMALFLKEVNAKRCRVYWLGQRNGRNGAESTVATWEGFYVRFASISGMYAQLRSMGTLTHPPKVPLQIQEVPSYMRHALAGWLRMKYDELSRLQMPESPRSDTPQEDDKKNP